MPTSLTKSSLSLSWTANPHRSGQRSKSDSSWASRYLTAAGLDYESRNASESHAPPDRVGAYPSFEKGREANVSCACHWTVNVAASSGHGKLYADAYSVAPAAVFVPPESAIRDPADLRGVPISVGHQSGSHYSTP